MYVLLNPIQFILQLSQLNNLFSLIVGKEPNIKISVIAGLMSLLHALVNPVLYGKMSQRYRRGYILVLKTILMLCGGERPASLNRGNH